jgi:hypothetical protein
MEQFPMAVTQDLVARIIAVLAPAAPYLAKAAESAASEMGKAAWQKARELYDSLRARFTADQNQKATQTLDLFIGDTDTFESALSKLLLATLAQHPEWAQEVRALLAEPALQEIVARNNSVLLRVTQDLQGAGTQRIEADNSIFTAVVQRKH